MRGGARRQLASLGSEVDVHGQVGEALCLIRLEGHRLVAQRRRVTVERRQQRHLELEARLVELHLREVDRLR